MSHRTGDRIGGFEVVAQIGEGGMGEVYRARDTRLDREVALKVLPAAFVSDPERLARFEREARVLALLNHPNIAQIYGFDANAIAMELVEGPTLDELIRAQYSETGSGLPFDRALAIARQIAVALEVAHDQGVVHRDLKPANIKVRDDGTVKVLDFGLAKAFAADSEAQQSAVSNSPTLTARSTQLGMIIGTAAYMSPEQAKARPVDRRADVWAFGVVLFEMLAGRRAFEGDDVSDVLASVLKSEPDWSVLPADLPASARRLLRRCLEKDPKKRLRDIGEGILQLDEGLAAGSTTSTITAMQVEASPPSPWRAFLRRWGAIGVTAIATALIVAGIGRWKTPKPVPPDVTRLVHMPPVAAPLMISTGHRDLSISPDGKQVVYQVGTPGTPSSQLYIRSLDQLEGAPVRGAQPAIGPVFSPTGEWIAFIDQTDQAQIRKVSASGGPPVLVARAQAQVLGLSWVDDGIVFAVRGAPLHFVPESGGEPRAVTTAETGELHAWPSGVPGTKVILFAAAAVAAARFEGKLAAIDRASGRMVRLDIPGEHPRYSPSGHIIYATVDGSLRAVGFDPGRLEVTGTPVPVLEGVGVKGSGSANFDISANGHLVYSVGGSITARRTLVWVDRTGRETPIPAPARNYFYARISPDGTRLSLDARDEAQDIWIWDLRRDDLSRLTDRPGSDQYGIWMPDHRVVFTSAAAGKPELFLHRPDGIGEPKQLTNTGREWGIPFPNAATPDGKQIIFRSIPSGQSKNDILIAEVEGGLAKWRKLLATEHDERNAALSPRGDFMVFESDQTGTGYEIFVRPFPDIDRVQMKVSPAGGVEPVWSQTGKEIFYLEGNQLMAVPVAISGNSLTLGRPAALFPVTPYFFGGLGRNYDVSPDGRRFVMVRNGDADRPASAPIHIVVNWVEELRARIR